jgi:hypothetical protein
MLTQAIQLKANKRKVKAIRSEENKTLVNLPIMGN